MLDVTRRRTCLGEEMLCCCPSLKWKWKGAGRQENLSGRWKNSFFLLSRKTVLCSYRYRALATSEPLSMIQEGQTDGYIRTIEWHMLDKRKFFPLSMASSFSFQCFLYPLTLVRTRLQVQNQSDVYRGTWHAFGKIAKNEGIRGLYRGFWVNSLQVRNRILQFVKYPCPPLGCDWCMLHVNL